MAQHCQDANTIEQVHQLGQEMGSFATELDMHHRIEGQPAEE